MWSLKIKTMNEILIQDAAAANFDLFKQWFPIIAPWTTSNTYLFKRVESSILQMFHLILDNFISCQNDSTFNFPLFILYFPHSLCNSLNNHKYIRQRLTIAFILNLLTCVLQPLEGWVIDDCTVDVQTCHVIYKTPKQIQPAFKSKNS